MRPTDHDCLEFVVTDCEDVICNCCGEHSETEKCNGCGEQLGTTCCGAPSRF